MTSCIGKCLYAAVWLLSLGSVAQGATLYVNCGAKTGFTSINGALKALQSAESHGPARINVSGACHENVVVQGMDRLTLSASPGASITDTSGGSAATVAIDDSSDVTISGFTINGGADTIDCLDGSQCRLNGNTIQGAVGGFGVGVFFSRLFLDGGTIRNNATGVAAINGASAKVLNVTIQNNSTGIEIRSQSFVNTNATITANTATGVFVTHNGVLSCPGCQITDNGDMGVILRRNSSARLYAAYAVTGNAGGGVLLSEESSAFFPEATGTVTGNPGGMDVYCGASSTTARFATSNIGGGTTNCVEPSP